MRKKNEKMNIPEPFSYRSTINNYDDIHHLSTLQYCFCTVGIDKSPPANVWLASNPSSSLSALA